MRRIIKNTIVTLICLVAFHVTAEAGKDKPISVSQLPVAAQQLLKKHFAGKKVALAKMESGLFYTDYDVIFTNGDKIEFNGKGEWTEVKCKSAAVPAGIVPARIAAYVRQNYPDNRILKIEKDDDEYEVNLSSGIEITFNRDFLVIDID